MKKVLLFSMGLLSAVLLVSATANAFSISGGVVTREGTDGRARINAVCERVTGRLSVSFICSNNSGSDSDFPSFATCGNNTVELGEQCDGSAPEGYSCTAQCRLVAIDSDDNTDNQDDQNQTPLCGNDVVEGDEECDGSAPEGYICSNSCVLQDISTALGTGVVINEVHFSLDNRHGVEPSNEWIELYNAGDQTVDLKNWTITDSEGVTRYLTQSKELAPGAFALITSDATTYTHYWSYPADTVLIILGTSIGSGLDNDGDALTLRNAESSVVDSMSYGRDTSVLTLGTSNAGGSLSRVAPGVDSDSSTDWTRLTTPTPGL